MDYFEHFANALKVARSLFRLSAHRHTHVQLSLVVKPLLRGSNTRGKNKKRLSQKKKVFLLAASHGFEPRLTESESAVLPLDDEAICIAN